MCEERTIAELVTLRGTLPACEPLTVSRLLVVLVAQARYGEVGWWEMHEGSGTGGERRSSPAAEADPLTHLNIARMAAAWGPGPETPVTPPGPRAGTPWGGLGAPAGRQDTAVQRSINCQRAVIRKVVNQLLFSPRVPVCLPSAPSSSQSPSGSPPTWRQGRQRGHLLVPHACEACERRGPHECMGVVRRRGRSPCERGRPATAQRRYHAGRRCTAVGQHLVVRHLRQRRTGGDDSAATRAGASR